MLRQNSFILLWLIFVSGCSVSQSPMQEKKSDCTFDTCPANVANQKTVHQSGFLKKECINIDGKYQDLGKRQSLVIPEGQYVLGGERSLSGILEGHAQNTDDLVLHVEKIREIPFSLIDKPTRHRVGPKVINDISRQKDESGFYKQAQSLLKREKDSLNLALLDKNGVVYKKITLLPKNVWGDCQKDFFVIKLHKIFGGAEGSSGSSTETELRFNKMDDGSLMLNIHNRIWKNSRLFGISGSPKVESEVFIFKKME